MHVERLERLIVVLQGVIEARRKFDLRIWVAHLKPEDPAEIKDDYCGTSACACGYAALDSVLSKQGLRLEAPVWHHSTGNMASRTFKSIGGFNKVAHSKNLDLGYVDIEFNGFHGLYAAASFFEVGTPVAHRLFSPQYYSKHQQSSPAAVITRLKKLIKHDEDRIIADYAEVWH